jgi:SAM-dependent methyltransferase
MDGMEAQEAFARVDETDDAAFYARDRLVCHVDTLALATIEELIGRLVVDRDPVILDLMASWDSHIPDHVGGTVIGLGLNERELAANRSLAEYRIHDLNANPRLPFADESFDAVVCSLSVDYMTQPVAVFRDVARVLRPGGMFLVVFSNRFFPEKVVRIWRQSSEAERVALVGEFFESSNAFRRPGVFVSKNLPRPKDDKYAELGIPSDPVYAVFADRKGAAAKTRPLPPPRRVEAPQSASGEGVLEQSGDVPACPHCGGVLTKWEVPQTPFTEWPSEYQFVCFNDHCPHFLRGWETMGGQGNPGSYRFMYDPVIEAAYSIPVLDKNTLRDGICHED